MLKRLPLGRSSFSVLRNENFLYVDKTRYAYNLITSGHRYFLSRPRRFGKSLFVSTLKEILNNNRSLFKDLWIDTSDYSWHEYGIIHLDLSDISHESGEEAKASLIHALHKIAQSYDIELSAVQTIPKLLFHDLVTALHKRFGRIAVLIDEYDHPILHAMHNISLVQNIQELIKNFVAAIKSLDEYIDFVFITGVSSFTKAGIFSGLNNLRIITLNDSYAPVCGYTDQEIDRYFHDYIELWAAKESCTYQELRTRIKEWYDGYHFSEELVPIYNPFSFMNAIEEQKCENYWLRSGAPTFLVQELSNEYRKREFRLFDPEKLTLTSDLLDIHDIEAIPLTTLLFQAGYLTIKAYNKTTGTYNLHYPNIEVQTSMQKYLLSTFICLDTSTTNRISHDLIEAFNQQDVQEAVDLLRQLFAHIPYQLHMDMEKFYHAILQAVCTTAGLNCQSEYSTSHGRIDIVLYFAQVTYVIEIKFNKSAQEALDQIEERQYYVPFLHQDKAVILIGLAFTRSPQKFEINYASRII